MGIAAAIGLALSLYLSVESFRSSSPAGCGPSAGCGELLAGPWSSWFGLPVSLPAAMVYLGMLVSSRLVKNGDRAWRHRPAGQWLALTSAMAGAAGIWFVFLSLAASAICPYCLCLHACGLAAAGLVWQRLQRWPGRILRPVGAALAVLVFGQLLFPRHPYRLQADVVTPAAPQPNSAPIASVRIIAGGRQFDLNPASLPVLGSPYSHHFIIAMSDYTCEHCRQTHRTLDRCRELFGDRVGVIVLPVLLDASGNPYLPAGSTHPLPQDRALTHLALSVFCAKPAAFAEMNRWLFAENRVRGEAEARAYAEQLVGVEALRNAEKDPRVQQITLTGCELFARTGSGSLPKLLVGSLQITGAVDDPNALLSPIQRQWSDCAVISSSR